jgi:hypothetical protein
VLRRGTLRTGLEFLPGAVLLVVAAHGGGHLVSHVGAKPVLAGGKALGALGALLLSGVPADGRHVVDVLPGLLTTSHEVGIALVLAPLSTIGGERDRRRDRRGGRGARRGAVTPGFGDAFRVAAGIALAASLLSLVALRRSDVAPGTAAALPAH